LPIGNAVSVKMPTESDTTVRVKPVAGFVAVTVAPGMMAPCWSTIRPEMLPVVCWASTGAASMTHRTRPARTIRLMPEPSSSYWKDAD